MITAGWSGCGAARVPGSTLACLPDRRGVVETVTLDGSSGEAGSVDVTGAVALVTGGASGLGLATAKALLEAGANVVILDLPTSAGEQIAKELGDRVRFAPADVRNEAEVTAALDVADAFGPLRVCVNCAGTGNAFRTVGKHGAFPLAEFTRIIEINLIGTFNVLRLAAERMLAHDPVGRGARRHRQHRVGRGVRRARSARRPTRRRRAAWSG